MDDAEPVRTGNLVLRKSAFGRTNLFLPTTDVLFREVKCMGGILRHDQVDVYHALAPLWKAPDGTVACWHCCEFIEDMRSCVPLPRVYDASERIYHVYGATCSPGCAKAYIIEHTTFDRGEHVDVLHKMLRDVYDVKDTVIEAPPRASLRRFGGVFDARDTKRTCRCSIVAPPFVSYCMLAEERLVDVERRTVPPTVTRPTEEIDAFEKPPPPAMYAEFLEGVDEASTSMDVEVDAPATDTAPPVKEACAPPTKRHAPKREPASTQRPTGPMAKFVRRK